PRSTDVPGWASIASRSAAARSRLVSPDPESVCTARRIVPSWRCSAAHPAGSTVTTRTSRAPCSAVVRAVAVAEGTTSRIATQSVSPGSPSNGRSTKSGVEFLAMRGSLLARGRRPRRRGARARAQPDVGERGRREGTAVVPDDLAEAAVPRALRIARPAVVRPSAAGRHELRLPVLAGARDVVVRPPDEVQPHDDVLAERLAAHEHGARGL